MVIPFLIVAELAFAALCIYPIDEGDVNALKLAQLNAQVKS